MKQELQEKGLTYIHKVTYFLNGGQHGDHRIKHNNHRIEP
jgi:hypothetical protein